MFTRLIISLSPKCCKKTKVKNARIEGAFLKRLNIQFDIQFVETLKNQGTNYPTAACEGFALVTAVFLWWNEVKQNIPTLRVFSQKKISIIRFFCGRSLFLKGKSETQILNRRSSYEKPTQTSCKRATKIPFKKSILSSTLWICIPRRPITMRTYPLSRKGSSISMHDTWMNYTCSYVEWWHQNIPGLVGGFPRYLYKYLNFHHLVEYFLSFNFHSSIRKILQVADSVATRRPQRRWQPAGCKKPWRRRAPSASGGRWLVGQGFGLLTIGFPW